MKVGLKTLLFIWNNQNLNFNKIIRAIIIIFLVTILTISLILYFIIFFWLFLFFLSITFYLLRISTTFLLVLSIFISQPFYIISIAIINYSKQLNLLLIINRQI